MSPNDRSRPRQGAATEQSNGLADLKSSYALAGVNAAIDNAATDWWFQGSLQAVKQLAMTGRGFTADHLLDMVGEPTDPHYVGAVFAVAQRQRIVEAVGCRIGAGGRLLRIWWGLPS